MLHEFFFMDFKKLKRIKKGGFDIVYEVEEKKTGKHYANKIIDCGDNEKQCDQLIAREVTNHVMNSTSGKYQIHWIF